MRRAGGGRGVSLGSCVPHCRMSTTLDARARHDVGINQGQTGADDVLKGCEATQSPVEGGEKRSPWGPISLLAIARAVCFPTLFDFIHQSCSLPIERGAIVELLVIGGQI